MKNEGVDYFYYYYHFSIYYLEFTNNNKIMNNISTIVLTFIHESCTNNAMLGTILTEQNDAW